MHDVQQIDELCRTSFVPNLELRRINIPEACVPHAGTTAFKSKIKERNMCAT